MDGLYDQVRIALHQIWGRRWLALGVAAGVCLLGWLVLALIPNSYESKAKVIVQLDPLLPSAMSVNPSARQGQLMQVRQSLTSTANLEKVVRRTELNSQVASPQDLSAQVVKLRESLKVVALPDDAIEITATSSVSGFSNAQNARTSQAVIQVLLDLFVAGDLMGAQADTGQTLAFLDKELKRREQALQEAEQRRVEFETNFMGLLPGDGSYAQRLSAARAELSGLDQQIAIGQSSLASLRAQMAGTPANMPGVDNSAGPASSQLAALEAQLAQQMGRGWTDSHPDVVATRQQIARLRPQANAERRSGGGGGGAANPAFITIRSMMAEKEAQVSAALTRKNQLQSDMNQLSERQTAEPGVLAEQERLNRDYDVLKRQYDKLLEDREQLRLKSDVSSSAEQINFKVIDRPSLPTAPATPNRPLLLTVILVFGLGTGIGVAFVMGQLQTTFPTEGKLAEATGLPVFGSVSRILSPAERIGQRQRLVWLGGSAGALVAAYALLMVVEFWQRSQIA